jgi:hypothetical protein
MAANSVTILTEMASDFRCGFMVTPEKLEHYYHAMSFAPGMDEFESYDTWTELYEAQLGDYDPLDLYELILVALVEQFNAWLDLGRPLSHEEWVRAKYPDLEEA